MPYTTPAKNLMLDALDITHVSLHTATPDASGSNELSGGSPAYARKAITHGAAASGERASTGAVTFDVPASTITHVGYWTAGSGGNFRGFDAITSETYSAQGTYELTTSTLKITDPA